MLALPKVGDDVLRPDDRLGLEDEGGRHDVRHRPERLLGDGCDLLCSDAQGSADEGGRVELRGRGW